MVYWRLFYHIVWATKNREPSIRAEFAVDLHNVIAYKASQMGARVHAVGGVEDHIHIAASVPPRIALSEFIRQLKGNSSHFVNRRLAMPARFAWQAEYGVVSFDGRQLDKIVTYVKGQRQHHLEGTAVPMFERMTSDSEK